MSCPPTRQTVDAGVIPRHRHAEGYVAVVLAGGYEEAGDRGRRRLLPGDVVVHQPWEAHLNRAPRCADVLNLPLPAQPLAAFGRVPDVDILVRTAASDPHEASAGLAAAFMPAPLLAEDWPERLAVALAGGAVASLGAWAETFGISREHLSRGFRQVFGVSPRQFRWEARSRAALMDLRTSDTPLAVLALTHGFADQAHMTRALRAYCGHTPGAWRRSNPFKTEARDRAI